MSEVFDFGVGQEWVGLVDFDSTDRVCALHYADGSVQYVAAHVEPRRSHRAAPASGDDPLAEIEALFDPDLDTRRLAAIERACSGGATWQQIAHAMGYSDRRAAEGWVRRRRRRTR